MNKITLMLAGLCLCGAAMAQETTPSVSGSNTAVVIKKAQVKSATGDYQLLVVPVKGYDITTGNDTEAMIKLSSMLPPDNYADKTVTLVYRPDGTAVRAEDRYTVSTDTNGQLQWSEDPELPAGTIFWLGLNPNAPTGSATSTENGEAPIVFCGNANTTEVDWSAANGQVTPLGNSTSEVITVGAIPGQPGAQLFRIKQGSAEYETYYYVKPWKKEYGWNKIGTNGYVSVADETIPAAEAFYFYSPATAE